MMFVLEALFYTIISRLIGKLFFKQKFPIDEEVGVFIVTFVLMSVWLLILRWVYE